MLGAGKSPASRIISFIISVAFIALSMGEFPGTSQRATFLTMVAPGNILGYSPFQSITVTLTPAFRAFLIVSFATLVFPDPVGPRMTRWRTNALTGTMPRILALPLTSLIATAAAHAAMARAIKGAAAGARSTGIAVVGSGIISVPFGSSPYRCQTLTPWAITAQRTRDPASRMTVTAIALFIASSPFAGSGDSPFRGRDSPPRLSS